MPILTQDTLDGSRTSPHFAENAIAISAIAMNATPSTISGKTLLRSPALDEAGSSFADSEADRAAISAPQDAQLAALAAQAAPHDEQQAMAEYLTRYDVFPFCIYMLRRSATMRVRMISL